MSTITPSLIRPGLLVSLKTSLRGGVSYEKTEIEAEHSIGQASTVARWETTRLIADAAEHDRATKARGRARTLVQSVCCPSSFGLLCPVGRESDLAAAIDAARAVADDHNATAAHSRVDVYVITGRVSDSDAEAARAIGAEMRELLADMERGIRAADPDAIREAANKARALSGMLSADVGAKVSAAIAQARTAAREIVRRVEKAGERAADVIDELSLERLQAARFAVLDLVDPDAPREAIAAPPPVAPALDLLSLELAADAPADPPPAYPLALVPAAPALELLEG